MAERKNPVSRKPDTFRSRQGATISRNGVQKKKQNLVSVRLETTLPQSEPVRRQSLSAQSNIMLDGGGFYESKDNNLAR